MLRRIDDLNHEREAEALEDGEPFFPMNIGLGINTGTCVVGNMGSGSCASIIRCWAIR